MNKEPQKSDSKDGNHHTDHERYPKMIVTPVYRIHANHSQFGVADPDNINDAKN